MKFGPEAIVAQGYGMPVGHMSSLQKAAEEIGPIGVRPVSKFARSYLEEGCPTKPFAVKNKSANSGIAAGLIAINPLHGRNPSSEDAKHNKQLADAYHKDPDLHPIPLIVTEARLGELSNLLNDKISIKQVENSNPKAYDITWQKEGKDIHVKAVQNKDGNFSIYDDQQKPVEVLGRTITGKNGEKKEMPITADYDLQVICPPYADFDPGNKDKAPFRTQGMLNSSEKKNIEAVLASENPNYTGEHESKIGGNWTPRIKEAVDTINRYVSADDPNRRGNGVAVVHHNAEFNNPFADKLENNVPFLMVFPKGVDLSSIADGPGAKNATAVLIETIEELNIVRNLLRAQGYHWPSHAKYKDQINPFREEAISATKSAVESMLKEVEPQTKVDRIRGKFENPPQKMQKSASDSIEGLVEVNALRDKFSKPAPAENKEPTIPTKSAVNELREKFTTPAPTTANKEPTVPNKSAVNQLREKFTTPAPTTPANKEPTAPDKSAVNQLREKFTTPAPTTPANKEPTVPNKSAVNQLREKFTTPATSPPANQSRSNRVGLSQEKYKAFTNASIKLDAGPKRVAPEAETAEVSNTFRPK